MISHFNQGGFLPTREQELLLKASLLKGENALEAWEQWKAAVNIDQLDASSYRLLPLLYRNLSIHRVNDPLMATFKGVYRLTWCKNQLLFHKISDVVQAFHDAGIRTMLLKGAALALNYYSDYGLRPMNDFDLLVPTSDAANAIKILKQLGWESAFDQPDKYLNLLHGTPFKHQASNQNIDLHWHIFAECRQDNDDDDFWRGSLPSNINGVTTQVLNPTHQLLHILVHGWRGDILGLIRWLADATIILNSCPDAIDWEELLSQAHKRKLVLRLKETLPLWRDLVGVTVPLEVFQNLQKLHISSIERLESKSVLGRRMPVLWRFISVYTYYMKRGNQDGTASLLELARYLQDMWGIEQLWQLPLEVIKRGLVKGIWIDLLGGKYVPAMTEKTRRQESNPG
jgi:Uncharacterised nucleotidyltransferase